MVTILLGEAASPGFDLHFSEDGYNRAPVSVPVRPLCVFPGEMPVQILCLFFNQVV